jgi:hypothetical protein
LKEARLMSTDDTEEIVEVPVKKFEVGFTLSDMLARVGEQADSVAESEPDAAENLRRLAELARQLNAELIELDRVKPDLLPRLKQPPLT